MDNLPEVIAPERAAAATPTAESAAHRAAAFWVALAALLLAFAKPLTSLVIFSWGNPLYSHIPLVPLIALVLARMAGTPRHLPVRPSRSSLLPDARDRGILLAALAAIASGALVAIYWWAKLSAANLPIDDELALLSGAFVFAVVAAVAACLGRRSLRQLTFPLGFLVFMIPLPVAAVDFLESGLQHGSAAVASILFKTAGTPVFQTDLDFQLPGINLRVAPECSGIHSTLALLMVALLAGHWYLRSPRRAALLAVAVVPLALLRNGLRIFTIGELCTRIGPEMIDSPIHRSGGPAFFVLSLVPFLLLLWLLIRGEPRRARRGMAGGKLC